MQHQDRPTSFTRQNSTHCIPTRLVDVMKARRTHLQLVVFACVGHQQILGALNIVRQLSLCQVCSKLL